MFSMLPVFQTQESYLGSCFRDDNSSPGTQSALGVFYIGRSAWDLGVAESPSYFHWLVTPASIPVVITPHLPVIHTAEITSCYLLFLFYFVMCML